jgi:hypothetical protein
MQRSGEAQVLTLQSLFDRGKFFVSTFQDIGSGTRIVKLL